MKLGTYLLRDAVIGLSQLEAGLRAQVLYGGRLGTNLVELGFIDVDTLAGYLGKMLGVGVATAETFEKIDPGVVNAFGGELAELYGAIPLARVGDQDEALAVAFIDPTDRVAIDALEQQCGKKVVPHIAAELRILYYLEKLYGVRRKVRFFRVDSPPPVAGQAERRRIKSGAHAPVRFEPRRKKKTQTNAPAFVKPVLDFDAAIETIEDAAHRDQIAEALLDFAIGRFEAAILFTVRYGNALGWKSYTRAGGGVANRLDQLSIALDGASVLQTAKDSGEPFRGPAPAEARSVEQSIWQTLSSAEPAAMLVVPVRIGERTVNLLYVQSGEHGELDDQACDATIDLAAKAGAAYERIVRAARDSR